jgi:hypothetical protein
MDKVVGHRDRSQETISQPKSFQTQCSQIYFTFIENKHNPGSLQLASVLILMKLFQNYS